MCKTFSFIFFKCERTSLEAGKKELESVIVALHVLSSCVSDELLGSVGRSSSLVPSNAERFPRLVGGGGTVWLADSDKLSPPSSRHWWSQRKSSNAEDTQQAVFKVFKVIWLERKEASAEWQNIDESSTDIALQLYLTPLILFTFICPLSILRLDYRQLFF